MFRIQLQARDDISIRYIGVDFKFGLLDCVRYIAGPDYFVIPGIVISGFPSIHFTLTGAEEYLCYIGNFAITGFVISGLL